MLWKNTVPRKLIENYYKIKAEPLFENHILVGGTALSLQLGHRESEDIDLFTLDKQDNNECINFFENNFKSVEIKNNKENILQVVADGIKIDLVSARGKLIEAPVNEENIIMCGIKDICGMKLGAIQGRRKPKDYIDIAYLLQKISMNDMLEIYKTKYPQDNIDKVKKALCEADKINPYEWYTIKMLKNDIELINIPQLLKNEVKKYNLLFESK
jgi:predicted nucleotidyltransferase component of viral defense system